MKSAGRQPERRSLRAAALVLLGVTLVAFGPFLFRTVRHGGSRWGFHDWPQFCAWYDLPRTTLLEHGELAFWNPYVSGGVPGFGHTHDPTFSPVFLVVLLFGPVTGTRVLVVLWTYLGMLSMFALARHFRIGRIGCYLAAIVWGLNGSHMLHLLVGHVQHVPMSLLPLAVLLFLRERRDRLNLFLTALLLAGLVLSGAIYPATYAGLVLTVLALWLAVFDGSARWLSRLLWVGVYAMFLAAVKLVATVPYLINVAPTPPDVSGTGPAFLAKRLIDPQQPWTLRIISGSPLGFWEVGAYVGVVVVVLFVLGLVLSAIRRTRRAPGLLLGVVLVTAAVFLLLSFGSRGPVDLFRLLRHVPVFASLHVPFRFVIIPLMAVALLAGIGLDWLSRRGKALRIVTILVVGFVAADLAWAYQHLVPRLFAIDAVNESEGTVTVSDSSRLYGSEVISGEMLLAKVGRKGDAGFQQRRFGPTAGLRHVSTRDLHVIEPHSSQRYLMQLQRRGNVNGYEMLRLRTSVMAVGDDGYRGEVFLQNSQDWKPDPEQVEFTPSRVTVNATFPADDVLFLNQNVWGGWYATIDGRTRRVSTTRKPGLVSAEVPAGQHTVVFWFRPDGFWLGLAVSLGSLAAVPIRVLLARRRIRRGPRPAKTSPETA